MKYSTWHEHGTKEKSESPTGIKPVTPRTPGGRSIHCARRTHGEQGHFAEFICDRCPAYCYDQHCRIHHHQLSKMTLLSMSSRSSVDRAPARCSGGHKFDSCRGLRFFLCPTLVSCWIFHISPLITELKIHHLHLLTCIRLDLVYLWHKKDCVLNQIRFNNQIFNFILSSSNCQTSNISKTDRNLNTRVSCEKCHNSCFNYKLSWELHV